MAGVKVRRICVLCSRQGTRDFLFREGHWICGSAHACDQRRTGHTWPGRYNILDS